MWWRSQNSGGCAQPGKLQPLSRATSANVCALLAIRFVRPRESTAPELLRTVGMISACPASSNSRAAGMRGAVGGDGVAGAGGQAVVVDGHDHRGRGAAEVGQVPGPEQPVAQVLQEAVKLSV